MDNAKQVFISHFGQFAHKTAAANTHTGTGDNSACKKCTSKAKHAVVRLLYAAQVMLSCNQQD
jgi:hypothetical protein